MRYAIVLAVLLSACLLPAWALTVEQEAKLLPADGAAQDEFGGAVAIDGDTAIVGAHLDDDNISNSGAAYVFVRIGLEWTEQAKLLASDGAHDGRLGEAVAIDGDTVLIGCPYDDDNGFWSGAVYVFTRAAGVWTEQAKLLASDGASTDYFGRSVALDGDTALIGADADDDNGDESGSVYVYVRTGGVWTEQTKLLAGDGAAGDYFGAAVAIDGDTAIIGAQSDDDNGSNSGSAYVFLRQDGWWSQWGKLLPVDGAAGDYFGAAVAIGSSIAIIGSFCDDDNGDDSGSAYVFSRTGISWTQQAKLLPADGGTQNQFGRKVALDGVTAIIGSAYDDDNGPHSGSAYVFTHAVGVWAEKAKLLPVDGAAYDDFGWSVAVDGDTALIGAWRDDDNGDESGSAYVFRLYDDDVPATNVVDLGVLLATILGTGFYFLRRRTGT
jgi:hypothetical protein